VTTNRVPVIQGLFAETTEGPRLLGSRCAACRAPYFPKSPVCHNPECTDQRIEDTTFGPRGTLWSFAVQYYAPPAPVKYDEPFVPFAIGVVDMPEGLRVLGRISIDDIKKIRIGMAVELVLERLCGDTDGNEVMTWKFRPVVTVRDMECAR
jgi:uncharacterized OB-fold protein